MFSLDQGVSIFPFHSRLSVTGEKTISANIPQQQGVSLSGFFKQGIAVHRP
jgi:hypothetical protein